MLVGSAVVDVEDELRVLFDTPGATAVVADDTLLTAPVTLLAAAELVDDELDRTI